MISSTEGLVIPSCSSLLPFPSLEAARTLMSSFRNMKHSGWYDSPPSSGTSCGSGGESAETIRKPSGFFASTVHNDASNEATVSRGLLFTPGVNWGQNQTTASTSSTLLCVCVCVALFAGSVTDLIFPTASQFQHHPLELR